MRIFLFLFFFLFFVVQGQSIVGIWKSFDENQQAKSLIEIYQEGDLFFGKVIELLDPSKKNAVCKACDEKDPRYLKPIEGMRILEHLVFKDNTYQKGKILDPKNGKIYSCKLWLEADGKLHLRAYLGPFFRTQVWQKQEIK